MEMKNDLDAPDQVQVTGRAQRLQTPKLWRTRWRQFRVFIITLGIPAIGLGGYFIVKAIHYIAGHLHWQ